LQINKEQIGWYELNFYITACRKMFSCPYFSDLIFVQTASFPEYFKHPLQSRARR
jgi:hypothetical protein